MSSVVIYGDTSGAITLAAPAVSGTNTLTLPALTGTVAINGPAFSASNSANQSISAGAFTKVNLDTEEFDTNSNFASSRFTPTVAGYYQFDGIVVTTTANTIYIASLYKNGAEYKRGNDLRFGSNQGQMGVIVSAIIYLNGSTDYVELYTYMSQNSTLTGNSVYGCYLQGCFLRGA